MPKSYAIIPAREGSKRIKNKNLIDFFGKPLISWTIDAAEKSNLFDDIIVSSDSDKILDLANKMGAKFFKRDKFYDDYSPISCATIYTALSLKLNPEDTIFQLMPNCPLRTSEDIINTKNFYDELNGFDSIISCFKFRWMNPWWALKKEKNIYKKLFKTKFESRSQDLESLYCPSGAIWASNLKTLTRTKSFYTQNHTFFEIPFVSGMDIDNKDDLKLAKALYILSSQDI